MFKDVGWVDSLVRFYKQGNYITRKTLNFLVQWTEETWHNRLIVGLNLLCMIVLLGAFGPPEFQMIVTVITIALQNILACKVFRLLKLGTINDPPSDPELVQSIQFISHRSENLHTKSNMSDPGPSTGTDIETGRT